MKNNTVNTEEKQESIRYVRYIFFKSQNSVPNMTREMKNCFGRCCKLWALEEIDT